jgi:hypothetical protein
MTPAGVDKKTLDGIDWDFFTNLGEKLKQGKFNFATSRKISKIFPVIKISPMRMKPKIFYVPHLPVMRVFPQSEIFSSSTSPCRSLVLAGQESQVTSLAAPRGIFCTSFYIRETLKVVQFPRLHFHERPRNFSKSHIFFPT